MRHTLVCAALLLTPSFASAWIVDAPEVFWPLGPTLSMPISISGGETDIQAVEAWIIVPSGGILGYDPKGGTILEGSQFPVDPPFIFNAQGQAAVPGSPEAIGIYMDYSMHFGGHATASGIIGTLAINIADLWPPGLYPVYIDGTMNPFGRPTVVVTPDMRPGTLLNGWFGVPEPAAAVLIVLGSMFLRRRRT